MPESWMATIEQSLGMMVMLAAVWLLVKMLVWRKQTAAMPGGRRIYLMLGVAGLMVGAWSFLGGLSR